MQKPTLLIILAVIVVAALGIFISRQNSIPSQNNGTQISDTVQTNNQTKQTVEEIGLTFSYPSDLKFRKEIGDNDGNIRTVAFYLEKGNQNNPEYQLYALFLADREASQQDLERSRTEMDTDTIKEASIDGYKGIEGLILGPKTRYITSVLKDGRLFSVSTYPPSEENKALTDKILPTFIFK